MDKAMCQFCLQLFTDNTTSFSDDYVNKLVKTIFVNKNLDAIDNSVICQMCLQNLNSAYNFMLSANENNLKMLDTTLECDDVCQTCLGPVEIPHVYLCDHSENIAPFSAIQKMLKYCLIKLDRVYRQCPIMCDVCWEILKLSYRFLVKCEQNEKKVSQFCKEHNITVVERRNIQELHEFCMGIPVEQNLHNVFEDINETDSTNNATATFSSASPDRIFSEIKIEIEENAISREIKIENVCVEGDDSTYDVSHTNESCNTLCTNIVNITIEDIVNNSDVEDSTDVNSTICISPLAHSNSEFCTPTIFENVVKKDLYIKLEKLNLKQLQNKTKKSRTARVLNARQNYKCDLCSYSSKKKYRYIRHTATHMTWEECAKNNRLFRCDYCNYKSKHKDGLKRHVRRIHKKATCVHSNNTSDMKGRRYTVIPKSEKYTFKCSHCKFETKVYASMAIHAVAHEDTQTKKLYKCEVCGYQVKKKSNMTRHVVTHLTFRQLSMYNKLYKCDICDYVTKRKDCLVPHANRIHGKAKKKRPRMK